MSVTWGSFISTWSYSIESHLITMRSFSNTFHIFVRTLSFQLTSKEDITGRRRNLVHRPTSNNWPSRADDEDSYTSWFSAYLDCGRHVRQLYASHQIRSNVEVGKCMGNI